MGVKTKIHGIQQYGHGSKKTHSIMGIALAVGESEPRLAVAERFFGCPTPTVFKGGYSLPSNQQKSRSGEGF